MGGDTKVYCRKFDCRHNRKLSPFTDAGICLKESLMLEEYPSKEAPSACADYKKEEKK